MSHWEELHRAARERMRKGQRYGQAYANAMFVVDLPLAEKLCCDPTSDTDPFYHDAKVPALFAALAEYWGPDSQ